MNNFPIQSKWTLWYHSITDNKWTKESYKKIMNINNLLDYQFLKLILNNNTFKMECFLL